MTFQERQLLKYNELSEHYLLLTDKIAQLRRGLAIETDIATRFKIEEELKQFEKERKQIERELISIEKNGVNSFDSGINHQHIDKVNNRNKKEEEHSNFVTQKAGKPSNVHTTNQKESGYYLFRDALNYVLSKEYEKAVLTIESVLEQYPNYHGAEELLSEAKEHLSSQQKSHIVEEKLELLSQTLQDSQFWHFASLKKARQEFDKKIETIESGYNEKIATIKQEAGQRITKIERQLEQFNFSSFATASWDNAVWNDWKPGSLSTKPSFLRFGKLKEFEQIVPFNVPALLSLHVNTPILFKAHDVAKKLVISTIQSLLLRLLSTIPPGKLRFTFIDPVGLGQNVAPFMHLADYDENLINYRAWSEKSHIEKRLSELTEHIENIIQKYLRNTYETIEEYNEYAGEIAESYRFLIVLDFPTNFSEEAVKRLISIIQNGPRCGIYTFILYDPMQQLPYGFNMKDVEQSAIIINWNEERFVWEDPDFRECQLEMEKPPKEELFNQIIHQVGRMAVDVRKVEVPFEKLLEKSNLNSENWWKNTTIDGIHVPLGPIGATKIQYLDLGSGTAQHVIVAGKTGSGKSTLLHVLISTIVLSYSPEEIELYLIDFKKGVEFKTYATHQLPHARVIAIESEREFGLSVIEGLDVELKKRGDLFRNNGVDSIKGYRQKRNEKIPRILLLVDEFQEFFVEDDSLAAKASQILDRLVRQGRAFGIHILLGSQTLAGAYTLARSTIDQMAVRIALQCSEADSRLILSDDNPAARLLSRPGEAIYNSANGLIEGNNPFQVAWLSDEKHDDYLDELKGLAKDHGYFPPKSQIIFEGNAPPNIAQNIAFNKLLENPLWSKSLKNFSALIGEPLAIKDMTTVHFRRQSSSNLLIVGQNDEAVMGIMISSILSLSAQHNPKLATFCCIDLGNADTLYADYLSLLGNIIPHKFIYGRSRQLPQIINAISQELDKRLNDEETTIKKRSSIYLFIYGIQRAHSLEMDNSFSFDMKNKPNSAVQFTKILREGPDLGIHTIIWCDTDNNLTRRLTHQILREFEMRVVFQMSGDDSRMLIDSSSASKLGQHRALFYNEEEGRLEKFRPFALPDEGWLKEVGKKLKNNSERMKVQ